jgi:hypothetical protein
VTVTLSRRTIAIAGAVVLIAASAIAWVLTSGDSPAASLAAPVPSVTRTAAEVTYLDQVKTTQVSLSDDEALRLGRDQCKAMNSLQHGGSVDFLTGPGSLEQMTKDGKVTQAQVRAISDASARHLCPENLSYYQSQIQ